MFLPLFDDAAGLSHRSQSTLAVIGAHIDRPRGIFNQMHFKARLQAIQHRRQDTNV
jgi:hypothetical protein